MGGGGGVWGTGELVQVLKGDKEGEGGARGYRFFIEAVAQCCETLSACCTIVNSVHFQETVCVTGSFRPPEVIISAPFSRLRLSIVGQRT